MSEQWYYAKGDNKHGPVEFSKLQQMATSRDLLPTELVWTESMDDWAAAETIDLLSFGVPAKAFQKSHSFQCPECGEKIAVPPNFKKDNVTCTGCSKTVSIPGLDVKEITSPVSTGEWDKWYYAKDGRQHGPINFKYLEQSAVTGKLSASDLVWKDGMDDWKTAKQVAGLSFGGAKQNSFQNLSGCGVLTLCGVIALCGVLAICGLIYWIGWTTFISIVLWILVVAFGIAAFVCGGAALQEKDHDAQSGLWVLCGVAAVVAIGAWFLIPSSSSPQEKTKGEPARLTEEQKEELARTSGAELASINFFAVLAPAVSMKKLNETKFTETSDLPTLRKALVEAEESANRMQQQLRDARLDYLERRKSRNLDVDEALVRFTQLNEALLADYAVIWADFREWTYSAEVFARRAESGELYVEAFVRGLNGDPFGTSREFRGEYDAKSIAWMKLTDRATRLHRRSQTLAQQFKPLQVKYLPDTVIPADR